MDMNAFLVWRKDKVTHSADIVIIKGIGPVSNFDQCAACSTKSTIDDNKEILYEVSKW